MRAVAAEIMGGGNSLQPLSADEQLVREYWRERQRHRAEQQRLERERRQAEKAAEAQRLADAERREWHQNYIAETKSRLAAQNREWEMANLKSQAAQSRAWQQNVEQAHANAVQQHYRNSLMGELEAMINPPQPPAEPQIDVERQEVPDKLKLSYPTVSRRWFER